MKTKLVMVLHLKKMLYRNERKSVQETAKIITELKPTNI